MRRGNKMFDKEQAKENIKLLVEKYNRLVESGKVKSYNEEMTKKANSKDKILPSMTSDIYEDAWKR